MNPLRLLFAAAAALLFTGGVVVGVLTSANADDDADTSTPTPEERKRAEESGSPPIIREAPKAVLRTDGGNEVEGGAGTRCWGNVCIDMVGPLSNPDIAAVAKGERFSIEFEAGTPSEVHHAWIPVSGEGELIDTGERLWQMPVTGMETADAAAQTAPATPGRYLYVVFAQWAGRGDISYGWYLDVR